MNHLFRVVLVLCLAAVAVAILIIANNRANLRPAHEQAVEEYVAYRRATTNQALTITQYVQARLPQNFRPDMSRASFGNATYYQTGQRYDQQSDASIWPFTVTATTVPTLTRMGYGGGKPMPYPPNDLWCAQLKSTDPAAPQVVVIALHQDIYNADWVMHEVSDPETVLAAVGCKFSVQ